MGGMVKVSRNNVYSMPCCLCECILCMYVHVRTFMRYSLVLSAVVSLFHLNPPTECLKVLLTHIKRHHHLLQGHAPFTTMLCLPVDGCTCRLLRFRLEGTRPPIMCSVLWHARPAAFLHSIKGSVTGKDKPGYARLGNAREYRR